MASWSEFAAAAPELADCVQQRFEAHKHKTMATIRKDGSPRISGTECQFVDGELWIGSMWQAVKALDLQRDPRYALHSGSDDPPEWPGDAKLSGAAEEITDPELVRRMNGEVTEGPSHLVRLNEARDKIVIELWHSGEKVRRIERA